MIKYFVIALAVYFTGFFAGILIGDEKDPIEEAYKRWKNERSD